MAVELNLVFFGPAGEGGVEVFNEQVDGFIAKLADPDDFFDEAADILELATAQQFATQGAYAGTPWEPIADSTLRKRQARSFTTQRTRAAVRTTGQRLTTGLKPWSPLQGEVAGSRLALANGPLEESFTEGGADHVDERISTGDESSMEWGSEMTSDRTGVCIPRAMHFGQRGHTPARPILVVTDQLSEQIGAAANKWVGEAAEFWGNPVSGGAEPQQAGLEFMGGLE